MTVYVVTGSDYDGGWVEGVYSTQAAADQHEALAYAQKRRRRDSSSGLGWNVDEWAVDDPRPESAFGQLRLWFEKHPDKETK